jgi:hypothetical protein
MPQGPREEANGEAVGHGLLRWLAKYTPGMVFQASTRKPLVSLPSSLTSKPDEQLYAGLGGGRESRRSTSKILK